MKVKIKITSRVEFKGELEMEPEEWRVMHENMYEPVRYLKGGKNKYWQDQDAIKLLERAGLDPAVPTNWSAFSVDVFEPITHKTGDGQ